MKRKNICNNEGEYMKWEKYIENLLKECDQKIQKAQDDIKAYELIKEGIQKQKQTLQKEE